jgi:magnesium transporter
MKRLAGWAAIFGVMTLMAGVWGMNFDNMPELHGRWGYPLALAAMGLTAGVLYAWLKRSGWL